MANSFGPGFHLHKGIEEKTMGSAQQPTSTLSKGMSFSPGKQTGQIEKGNEDTKMSDNEAFMAYMSKADEGEDDE